MLGPADTCEDVVAEVVLLVRNANALHGRYVPVFVQDGISGMPEMGSV